MKIVRRAVDYLHRFKRVFRYETNHDEVGGADLVSFSKSYIVGIGQDIIKLRLPVDPLHCGRLLMNLKDLLKKQRSSIIDKWFDSIIESYPANTAEFLKKKEGFTNPVGQTTYQGIQDIFDGLMLDADASEIAPFLDAIIRIRAVQDFTPSQAVNFVFLLKKILRDEVAPHISGGMLRDELDELQSKIDILALLGFDIFMKCREKLYDIKANELRDRTLWLLKKSNLLTETPDEPATQDSGSSGKY